MARLLTTRKQSWVDQFQPKVIKGKPLNPSISSEQRYYDALRKVILQAVEITDKEVAQFYKAPAAQEYFAQDVSVSGAGKALLERLQGLIDGLFGSVSEDLARDMTLDASQTSARSLKSSLKELSGGLTLKTDFLTRDLGQVMQATIAENVSLIKSIGSQYLTQIQGAVMRSITTGNGLADLVPFLRKQEGVTLRRARFIAEDQTRKAYGGMNKARMEKIGLKEFEWLHSGGGQEPRPLHILSCTEGGLNHGIYSFDNLPIIDKKTGERGIPGQLIRCRCRMRPVVRFKEDSNDAA